MITQTLTLNKLLTDAKPFSTPISQFIYKQSRKVNTKTTVGRVSRILERENYVVVVDTGKIELNYCH